jgi:hypothetical protein
MISGLPRYSFLRLPKFSVEKFHADGFSDIGLTNSICSTMVSFDATRIRQSERRYPNSSIGFWPVAALAGLSAETRVAQRKRSNSSRTARATSTYWR